jgi:hypothetical protein
VQCGWNRGSVFWRAWKRKCYIHPCHTHTSKLTYVYPTC